MFSNPGKLVTIYSVTGITGKSFKKGFNLIGIHPLSESVFNENKLLLNY
jgi:hypothetical protein